MNRNNEFKRMPVSDFLALAEEAVSGSDTNLKRSCIKHMFNREDVHVTREHAELFNNLLDHFLIEEE